METTGASSERRHSLPIISRGMAFHVDDCPIAIRDWYGKPYANVMDDCTSCVHQRGIEFTENDDDTDGGVVHCAGFGRLG